MLTARPVVGGNVRFRFDNCRELWYNSYMRKRSDIREIAKAKYQELIASGTPIPLAEFARRSVDLIGYEVSEANAKYWSVQDHWNDVSVDSMDAAGQTKEMILKSYERVLSAKSAVDISNYARAFSKIVGSLDPRIRVAFNGLISDVMSVVRDAILSDDVASSRISNLSTTWSVLNRYTEIEIETDEEGINPDGILLGVE